MGQFVDDHIFHEFARFEGELTGVGDLSLREVADAPKGLHAAKLPGDARFVQTRGPEGVQFREQPFEQKHFQIGRLGWRRCPSDIGSVASRNTCLIFRSVEQQRRRANDLLCALV